MRGWRRKLRGAICGTSRLQSRQGRVWRLLHRWSAWSWGRGPRMSLSKTSLCCFVFIFIVNMIYMSENVMFCIQKNCKNSNVTSLHRMVPLLLLSLISTSCAFYSSSDAVVNITPANFDTEVTNSDSLWIIEFYAPWLALFMNLKLSLNITKSCFNNLPWTGLYFFNVTIVFLDLTPHHQVRPLSAAHPWMEESCTSP